MAGWEIAPDATAEEVRKYVHEQNIVMALGGLTTLIGAVCLALYLLGLANMLLAILSGLLWIGPIFAYGGWLNAKKRMGILHARGKRLET